jgi:uncharacterized protein (DUF885 family)
VLQNSIFSKVVTQGMIKRSCAILISVVMMVGCAGLPAGPSSDERLTIFIDDYWQNELRESPFLATIADVHDYDHLLNDISLAAHDRRVEDLEQRRQQLAAIDAERLSVPARVNYRVLSNLIDNRLYQSQYKGHLLSISSINGWHLAMARLLGIMPFKTPAHYENYIARLEGTDTLVSQGVELLRAGIAQGYVQPCQPIVGVDQTFLAYVSDSAEQNMLFKPLQTMPVTIPAATQAALRARAATALEQVVTPAFQRMYDFWVGEYVPRCRQDVGLSGLPDGAGLYAALVRGYTTTDLTPEQIHTIGLQEVARIRDAMDGIRESVDFSGDLAAFLAHLRSAPQFYTNDPELYLAKVALVAKRFDEQLPKLFGKLPPIPFTIKPYAPDIAPRMPAGSAEIAPADGSGAGVFRINLSRIETRPLFNIVPLTLHEAMPGHHLQMSLGMGTDLPAFRKLTPFSAYMEGWGLYAEWLGVEAGMYTDPYDDFGRLTFEMWRACRLVVDTGIHAKGWSRQQAIDYMAEHTALSLNNIRNEVDRYITFPGQATSYKIGQLKILELRRRAEAALGENFDVRGFHDTVLASGAVPLKVLEQLIGEWITEQGSGNE